MKNSQLCHWIRKRPCCICGRLAHTGFRPTTHTLRPKSDHESQSQRPIVQPLKPSSIALNTDYPSRTTSSAHATKRRKLQRPSVSVPLLPRAISMVSFHQKINFDCLFSYRPQPPTTPDLLASLGHYNLPTKIYQSAYYSDENDAPEEPSEFGGLTFSLQGGRDIETLKEWVPTCRTLDFLPCDQYPEAPVAFGWEYAGSPPSYKEAKKWLTSDQARHLSEIRGRRLRSQVRSLRTCLSSTENVFVDSGPNNTRQIWYQSNTWH